MNHLKAYKQILDIYWEDGESKTELEEKLRRIEDIADEMYHNLLNQMEGEANEAQDLAGDYDISSNAMIKLLNLPDDTPTGKADHNETKKVCPKSLRCSNTPGGCICPKEPVICPL